MANQATHKMQGMAAGGVLEALREIQLQEQSGQFDLMRILNRGAAGAAGGYVGGMLPDMLEPATSPHHRKFFHSYAFLLFLFWAIWQLLRRNGPSPMVDSAGRGVAYGYGAHLLEDRRSPAGLPPI